MNKNNQNSSFRCLLKQNAPILKFLIIIVLILVFSSFNNAEAAVTYQTKGAFASGTGALTVAVPSGYQNGDVFLLFVESANQTIATPSGWTQLTNSPQGTGTAAAIGGVRLAVFYKVVSGVQSSVTVADSGNHTTAIIMNFRGVDTSAPINVTAGSVGIATNGMVFPSATTTVANAAIILAAAMDTDANSTTTVTNWANANISSLTELHDQTITSGVGGGLAIAAGYKVSAGATGTSTATGSTSVTHAYMTIALKPLVWTVSGTSTNTSASGATVRVAINGTLQAQTTTLNCSGNPCTWSIPSVSPGTNGSIITTWIQNVTDDLESTAVTKYISGTTISGMVLNKNTLTIGSNQNTTLSTTELGGCDSETGCASEDIMHVSKYGALNVMGSNTYEDAVLSILASNTLTVSSGSSESVTTDRIVNSGTITSASSPTYTLSGRSGTLFANNGTFTADKSEVKISSEADVTLNSGSLTLFDLTSTGSGEKSLGAAITFATNGELEILRGTFNPGTYLATGSGANILTVASGAVLKVGASTFSGNYSSGFSTINLAGGSTVDYSASGNQTISSQSYYNLNTTGSGTKTLGGNISVAGVLTIGTGTTLSASSYEIELTQSEGNTPFIVNGTFNAGTGTVRYEAQETNLIPEKISGAGAWNLLSSSSDGTRLMASQYLASSYGVYISNDSGVSWNLVNFLPSAKTIGSLASSSDGRNLAVGTNSGYIYISNDYGVTWTERASSNLWRYISSSSDGSKLFAFAAASYLYISLDGGVTWTENTTFGIRNWKGSASSSDGTKVAVAINNSYIYTSTDSGATWTERTSSGARAWEVLASSADGTKLVGVVNGGYIYTSTDSGATWTERTSSGSRTWNSIASSTDGTKLVAVVENGYVYTSTDSGATWTERTSMGLYQWSSVVSSSDGSKIVIAPLYGYINTSINSGTSWIERAVECNRNWQDVSLSYDGLKAVAIVTNGYMYISLDGGQTWNEKRDLGARDWRDISLSNDGTRMVASVGNGGYIYTSTDSGATWTEGTLAENWLSSIISADGTKMAASITNNIKTSLDGGETWTNKYRVNLGYIEGSSDLINLVSAKYASYIYTSNDFGVSWAEQTALGAKSWLGFDVSADGQKIVAGVQNSYIYMSNDGGVNWIELTEFGVGWAGTGVSSDGSKIVLNKSNGNIYVSQDGGSSWSTQVLEGVSLKEVDISGDGKKIMAGASLGDLYVSSGSQSIFLSSGYPTFYNLSISGSGTRTLAENLAVSNTLTLSGGTLDTSTSNYSINAGNIALNGGALTSNASTITLTGTGTVFNYTSGTFTPGTSTIKITNSGATGKIFAGGGQTYNNIWYAPGTGTGSLTISGSNTFNNFKDDGTAAHSLLFTTGTTQNIASWTVAGNVGNLITINSTTTGTHTLNYTGTGTANSDYLNIQHSVATPASTWYAGGNSVNNQAVVTAGSGWVFGAITLTITQGPFRLFGNENGLTLGNPLTAENMSSQMPGNDARVRMMLEVGGATLLQESETFNLQYAQKSGTCDTAFTGESYQDMDYFSTLAFQDNPIPNDGDTITTNPLDPHATSGEVVPQSYIESNNFGIVSDVAPGNSAMFDFSLRYTGVQSQASYCLRVVKKTGELLDSYTYIPELISRIYRSRRGNAQSIESGVTPSGNTIGGTKEDGADPIVLPQCSDTIDNDSDTLVDTLDPQCHLDGSLGKEYIPTHNSETIAPVTQTGGGQGDSGGDIGFNWRHFNLFNLL